MSKVFLITASLFFLLSATISAQTANPPETGEGTAANPYEIATLNNLYWIVEDSERWDKHYIQTADIDASGTVDWFAGEGWHPIGYFTTPFVNEPFTGQYNGQGHEIKGLYIKRPETKGIGLFGFIQSPAIISNLGITDADITGQDYVGGLAGASYTDAMIINCYSTGSTHGNENIGGLIGLQYQAIVENSFSTAAVSGRNNVGGLVGDNYFLSIVKHSYSTGTVVADNRLSGGLAGRNWRSQIIDCFSTGNVSGHEIVGGLAGSSGHYSTIKNSYSIGSVSGNLHIGGMIGNSFHNTIVSNSYWNIETSGQSSSAAGEGRTTQEMSYPNSDDTYVGWDFVETWSADVNHNLNYGYPYLQGMHLSIEDDNPIILHIKDLSAFPNPFNPETTISFSLSREYLNSPVTVTIYNIRGQKVRDLMRDEVVTDQQTTLRWDARNESNRIVSSGIYYVTVRTGTHNVSRKMTLLK